MSGISAPDKEGTVAWYDVLAIIRTRLRPFLIQFWEVNMKVFISQAMNGKSHEEIQQERDTAIETIRQKFGDDIEVLDTFFYDFDGLKHPLEFLGKAIMMLAMADVAYFVDGWESARGCRIEYQCCGNYGVDVIGAD